MRPAAALLLTLGLISCLFAALGESAPDRLLFAQLIDASAYDLRMIDLALGIGLSLAGSAILTLRSNGSGPEQQRDREQAKLDQPEA